MQPIPEDILVQFNAVLKQKAVPSSLHDNYRKWLKYYLDFRVKYPPPDIKSEQVRLFIEKMRSKGKTGKDLYHAAQALSLFFSLQSRKRQAASHAERVRDDLSAGTLTGSIKKGAGENRSLERTVGKDITPAVRFSLANRPGRKYDEWWCLNKTKSPAWDRIIEKLAEEIKTRHY
jgi:hypothetical protein